jgi:hypothetical protein
MNNSLVFQPVEDFLEQFCGDREVCLEIASVARADIEGRMKDLTAAGMQGDCSAFARHLHAMRGVVGTFGCEDLAEFLNTTEKNVETSGTVSPETVREVEVLGAEFLKALGVFEDSLRSAG